MARVFDILVLSLVLFCNLIVVKGASKPKFFDVVKYGAVPDGKSDNSKVFLKAWNDACEYHGRSRVLVPAGGTFLLDETIFSGPCNGSMAFIVKGTLVAPTTNFFTDTWIGFRYLTRLSVQGGGRFDGQGHVAWPYNDCQTNHHCKPLPVSMRFDFIKNSKIHNIHFINSKNTHICIFASNNINITKIKIDAPGDSPNTDGIRIGLSSKITISRTKIRTGDDCISMLYGSQDIDINDVACGPGHGISIGSLGNSHQDYPVTGISVRNCSFFNTQNGVRIKTYASSTNTNLASNIVFQDIFMKNSSNPIIIDQHYGSWTYFDSQNGSGVQIKDVTFKNIWGSSRSKVAVNIQCNGANPCQNVKLVDIDLAYRGPGGGRAVSKCSNVFGSCQGKVIPGGCL